MKKISIQPLNKIVTANDRENLLQVLLRENMSIVQACGAQGRCATCHVYVKSGNEALSPMNDQERLTLNFIATAQPNSRLACQTTILRDGAVIEVPRGMYIGSIGELKSLIGTRATQNIIHPLTGEILVEENKLILRSALEKMANIDAALETNLLDAFNPPSISNIANYFD